MKTKFLMVCFTIATWISKAQINKGTKAIGMDFNIYSNNSKTTDTTFKSLSKSNNLNLNLGYGYFIANNLSVGLNLGFRSNSTNYNSNNPPVLIESQSKTSSNTLSIAPHARYYYFFNEKLAVFGQTNIGVLYSFGNNDTKSSNGTVTSHSYKNTTGLGWFFKLSPGLTYFVTDKVAFETSFGFYEFTMSKNKSEATSGAGIVSTDENKTRNSLANFNFNMSSFNLGVKYYIKS